MHKIRGKSNVDNYISFSCGLKIGAGTLPILSMGKWLLPTGKQLLVCDRFSLGEVTSGKFPWIYQSEQKNYPWLFPRYLKRLNQSQELDWKVPKKKNHVLFTCWVRHGAKSNANNWAQCSKPYKAGFWALLWMFFLYFTLNKFKGTLKHYYVFFTCF